MIRHKNPATLVIAAPVIVGGARLCIEDVAAVAQEERALHLNPDPAWQGFIQRGAEYLDRLLAENGTVYGVTTGYGDSCSVAVPAEHIKELPLHLTRYHGCGLGAHLDRAATRAVLACRLNSLAQGYSAVRLQLLDHLVKLLEQDILPLIPEEGSVGASGDLTPLSYVAATLVGERDVLYKGKRMAAAEALKKAGIPALNLAPKEGLAIMNGTAVMTALACLAFRRAEYLTRLASRITALACLGLRGNRGHFDPRLFALKPHAGQNQAAAWIYADLHLEGQREKAIRLQDRYSIRCAPHVIGVLRDALPWMRRDIENELNSANDNPLIDGEGEHIFHGGHFYGGHIAFVMDAMKNAVANLADLMDRQLALLVDSRFNHGLPQNLSGASEARAAINHGFKAVQIGASAWTAEALKLTMPASVFSRSTECHNQDKVSMGTIAARDCLRVIELTEQVAAALVLATWQGVELRRQTGKPGHEQLAPEVRAYLDLVGSEFAFLEEDRPLEDDLRQAMASIRARAYPLYADTPE